MHLQLILTLLNWTNGPLKSCDEIRFMSQHALLKRTAIRSGSHYTAVERGYKYIKYIGSVYVYIGLLPL